MADDGPQRKLVRWATTQRARPELHHREREHAACDHAASGRPRRCPLDANHGADWRWTLLPPGTLGHVDIKIGILNVTREVSIESTLTGEEVSKKLSDALASNGLLDLSDEKGRRVIVPAQSIGYIDLGPENARKVGFGSV